ncbi:Vegetative incompatibility protein HET-E-1 OS=Podospora anserina GN=HET-E1 PE=4 SV=1 [Rhizoctonia solani AG-1 IB]|uniref:Vegetative incompatibility protein HET-E-1 n=1 Tax=Thanatephorus cucumeris (strain AG1-IB / isolate 7/3/14) TaxID=1108050 RepID=A0A0B7FKG1_THACB|nr:Vegetative incompatibility protein HET-E-1 OS=Podospora anserina GN=HET-E1 PE=4 SV=1 [Rhizoctonia solani AG-1 IB]
MSSRPEKEIARKMAGRLDGHDDARLVLHDLDSSTVKADIETYMRRELKDIPMTDGQWTVIIERCGVLFIYASTTCRYIKQTCEFIPLDEVIDVITSSKPTDKDKNAIDELYMTVLDAAFVKSGLDGTIKERMKNVLETVVCAVEPMTVDAMARLLGLETGNQIERLLMPLRSVLNVAKKTGLVSTLHASFPDFMLSSDRSGSYHCHYRTRHLKMTKACLNSIDANKSKFNICGLASSYDRDSKVEGLEKRVNESISPALVYACRYWSKHLNLAESSSQLIDIVHNFFSSRLLLWMEVINLTKHIRHATSIIQDAERWCMVSDVINSVNCVRFSADGSALVSGSYDGTVQMWDVRTGQQTKQLLKGDEGILSVGMSSDGRRLVCGSMDGRIRVVDGHTDDTLVGPIQAHTDYVRSVEMWADGMRFVSGSDDSSVRIWDGLTGKQAAVCGDDDWSHSGEVLSVCVSPNGLYVASGSFDGTVCVWDGQNGKRILGPLRGHTSYVFGVQFSPDGSHVVSCSEDGAIRFWDVSSIGTGAQEQEVPDAATGPESTDRSSGALTPDLWTIDEDGWAMDSRNQRVVWVPADLRTNLAFPPTSLTISGQGYCRLGTEGREMGDKWMDFYQA